MAGEGVEGRDGEEEVIEDAPAPARSQGFGGEPMVVDVERGALGSPVTHPGPCVMSQPRVTGDKGIRWELRPRKKYI